MIPKIRKILALLALIGVFELSQIALGSYALVTLNPPQPESSIRTCPAGYPSDPSHYGFPITQQADKCLDNPESTRAEGMVIVANLLIFSGIAYAVLFIYRRVRH